MTKRKIPKNDQIISAIKEVLRKRRVVQSQEDLCYLTLEKLKKKDENFVLSPRRVKKLALKIPGVEIKAKTKRVAKVESLEKCPVCGKEIEKRYSKDLLGRKIHVGYICKKCGYSTGLEALVPMRYIFILKKIE